MINANTAPIAFIAYAQIMGVDGTSPLLNSGVATAKVATGHFTVTLPTNPIGQQLSIASPPGDLIFVQPIGSYPVAYAAVDDDTNPAGKHIYLGNETTSAIDADFNVLICRSLNIPVYVAGVPQPV